MDSLYSGHEGISFDLKAAFASIAAMVTAFKQGADFHDVWFGEYCIIDTPNKNDRDNGKIFKRGYDYQNDMGGAIYLSQIVGPSSGTPYFQLNDIPTTKSYATQPLKDYQYRRYPYDKDENGRYLTTDGVEFDPTTGKPYPIKEFDFDIPKAKGLVPGKYVEDGTEKFNDAIKYTWVNLRDDNNDSDSWFYVGWQNVYTVIDYITHSISPYDESGNYVGTTTTERVDDYTHPFYEKWNIGIPKGVKGDTLRNLRVVKANEIDATKIYEYNQITVNTEGQTVLGTPGYDGMQDDIDNKRTILIYDFYVFDQKKNPQPVMVYVGDFNIIDEVRLDDNGTLTVGYTHDNDTVFDRKIKWITGMTLTSGLGNKGGHLKVDYNNGSAPYETDITWIRDITVQENGDLVVSYCGTDGGTIAPDGISTIPAKMKWIKKANDAVSLNADNGVFTMKFNNDTAFPPYTTTLDWVKDITFNQQTGEITIHHTTGDKISETAKLKILIAAEVNDKGVMTLIFNTGEKINVKIPGTSNDFHIKLINDVRLNTGINEDKRIQIIYNYNGTSSTTVPIGNPINYIERMTVRPSDWHLFVLYSDKTHRKTAADLNEQGLDANKVHWVSNDTIRAFDTSVPNYGVDIYWQDFGTIKDQAGVLVGFNLSYDKHLKPYQADHPDATIIDYLNDRFPSGLTGEDNAVGGVSTKQKIITYAPKAGAEDRQNKEFYAFDYLIGHRSWYYLGSISDTGERDAKLLSSVEGGESEIKPANIANVRSEGLIFNKISTKVSANPMPQVWLHNYTA